MASDIQNTSPEKDDPLEYFDGEENLDAIVAALDEIIAEEEQKKKGKK